MILFYGEGRLGNQIFQYQALNHIATRADKILAVGLEQLEKTFRLKGPRVKLVTRSPLLKRFFKFVMLPLVLRPLAKTLRLFNYATEGYGGISPHGGPSGEIVFRRGLIRNVTIVDGGYYQNSLYWKDCFPAKLMELNSELRGAARAYLRDQCPVGKVPVFVHVRRGDYLGFTAYGLDNLELPIDFYRRAISSLKQQFDNIHFVFVTDDTLWVEENFSDTPIKSIASFSPTMDFAIMTECRSGVVSNSTFSLAAAFMMNDPDLVVGPEYWFGFRVGAWYPPKICCSHEKLLYLSVNA